VNRQGNPAEYRGCFLAVFLAAFPGRVLTVRGLLIARRRARRALPRSDDNAPQSCRKP
jgi:hypothetical protein